METHSNERVEGPIDYPITDKEFEAAINKLKANKSPGIAWLCSKENCREPSALIL